MLIDNAGIIELDIQAIIGVCIYVCGDMFFVLWQLKLPKLKYDYKVEVRHPEKPFEKNLKLSSL